MTEARLAAALADHYRVEREFGAGGMATVYLAHDLKHDRKVAIKVLHPELSAVLGAERFLSEIKTTAALQHPHILPLFDSGAADGFLFYVMPLVEGETLRERLTREKQLPITDAVRIAGEVAGALDYAHRRGVIHRDIKPENILLHDGRALVADFGIALAVSRSDGASRMTETGMSLGTPHYMSPEQAMGERELDARTDIYALGCVLYEMLTGEPPFTGPTAQSIVAKVMTDEPRPPATLRKTIPEHLEAVTLIALAKLPADRFASAAEFAAGLTGADLGTRRLAGRRTAVSATLPHRRTAALAFAFLATGALAAWGWLRPHPVTRQQLARFFLAPPDGVTMGWSNGRVAAISPDGNLIVFRGTPSDSSKPGARLYLRRIGAIEVRELPGTERASSPFFSPDGESVGFLRGDTIKRVGIAAGAVSAVAGDSNGVESASWGEHGTIVFSDGISIFTVPEVGGPITRVRVTDSTARLQSPEWLPGGAILVSISRGNKIAILDPATGELTIVVEQGLQPHFLRTGYLVFGRPGGILAVPFDVERRKATGPVTPVLPGVMVSGWEVTQFAVADNGTAVYLTGTEDHTEQVVVLDPDGKERVLTPRGEHTQPRFSPDGKTLVMEVRTGMENDLYLVDVRLGTLTRLTFKGRNRAPLWSRDGKSVTYFSSRAAPDTSGIYRVPADGSGPARLLFSSSTNEGLYPGSWSPDGRSLLYSSDARGRRDLGILSVTAGSAVAKPYLNESWAEATPNLSPDGRWVAYASDEGGGNYEVFVRSFPIPGAKYQVSQGGGIIPRWSPDGHTLYYLNRYSGTGTNGMPMAAEVDGRAGFRVLSRRELPALAKYRIGGLSGEDFDIHPDGKTIVALKYPNTTIPGMTVVLNWFEELKARTKAVRR